MILDKEFNPNHCEGCTGNCGDCQDAYKTKGGIKHTDTLGGLWVFDPKGYCVRRYAQKRAMEHLLSRIKIA